MEIISLSSSQIISFLLIFFRVGAIMFSAPFFGARNIPVLVRILLSFTVAVLITSAIVPYKNVQIHSLNNAQDSLWLFMAIIKELLLGIAIGFIAQLTFTGIQMAGQLIGNDMGFGMMNIMDPSTHGIVTVTAELNTIIATLIFLITYSHHYVLMAIAKSFETIPLGSWGPSESFVEHLNVVFGSVFATGLKLAIPVMAVLFLAKIAMAIVARTMPQMNFFAVGFPIQITVGLLAIAVSLPFTARVIYGLFLSMRDNIWLIFR
jgi:flagellar biosynthetic protein FliR